jgi:hypothetical protein
MRSDASAPAEGPRSRGGLLFSCLALLLALSAGAQGEPAQTDPMAPVEGGSSQNPPSEKLPEYKEPLGTGNERVARPETSKKPLKAPKPSVAASTSAAAAPEAPSDEVAGRGFKVGGAEPKAKLSRPMHAIIHKDAVDWEPLAIKEGGVPGSAENAVALKVVKIKGRMKGESSKAKSAARAHKGSKDSRWLVISLYPKSLERRRTHLEVRFRMFEGYVEEVQAAAVTVTERRKKLPAQPLDSYDLRAQGFEYEEELPGSGLFVVAELDPRPGSASRNSGRLEKAEFADKDLGFVNLSWSAKGVAAAAK